jgi:predicted nucleic acid-binding protein
MSQNIVFDTNVLISALLTPGGTPDRADQLAIVGDKQICYCSQNLAENQTVLSRPKFRIDGAVSQRLLEKLVGQGVNAEPTVSAVPMPDETDRIFYDTARCCGALLLTGNGKHYPKEPFILTPAEFLGA